MTAQYAPAGTQPAGAPAQYPPTPKEPTVTDLPETDEQRADREETEREHAAGIHTHCGLTCEVDLPTEHLRNFIIAKGYPGTAGALDELLRRAATPAVAPTAPPAADRATLLRELADVAETLRQFEPAYGPRKDAQVSENVGVLRVADHFRRLADEAQQPETEDDDPICGDRYDDETCELEPEHPGAHCAGIVCWDYGRAPAPAPTEEPTR